MNKEVNNKENEKNLSKRIHHSRLKIQELKSSKALDKKGGAKGMGCVPCLGQVKPQQ